MFAVVEITSNVFFFNYISYIIDAEIYFLNVLYFSRGVKSNQ